MFVFISFCFCSILGVFGDDVKSVSVTEGDSVTLHNNNTELQTDDVIQWLFGSKGTPIARHKRTNNKIFTYDVDLDEGFRDKLQMDHQTGSLTITNIRTQHTGLYEMVISGSTRINSYKFQVSVYAHLPVPVIISSSSNSSQNSSSSSSSSSSCVFVCSVMNVSHVTLSWYKGNSLVSSISVSDLISSISLHLKCLDVSYRCVINNPIRSHTTHLNITQHLTSDDCQPCPDRTVLYVICAAAVGSLMIVAAVLIFCRKHKNTQKQDKAISYKTDEQEFTYADPTSY